MLIYFPATLVGEAEEAEFILDETTATAANVPTFDDSAGTAYYDNGTDKVAIAWGDGYTVSKNGVTTAIWRPYEGGNWSDAVPLPIQDTPGDIYYVATDGDDATGVKNDDTKPFKTIGKLNTLTFGAGDSVLFKAEQEWTVAAGTFDASFDLKGAGTTTNWIKMGQWGAGDKPILNGEATRTYFVRVGFTGNNNYWWIDNIDFKNGVGTGDLEAQIRTFGSTGLFISECVFRDHGNKGIRTSSLGSTLLHNDFSGMPTHAIQHYPASAEAHNNVYAYNSFDNCGGGGVTFDGIRWDDKVFGGILTSHNHTNHAWYREHNATEYDEARGITEIHHNSFILQDTGTYPDLCLAIKGLGARVSHNKFYGQMGTAVCFHIPRAYPDDPNPGYEPEMLGYAFMNLTVGITGTPIDDDYKGAFTLDRFAFDAQFTTNGYGQVWINNNTIVSVTHGINWQSNWMTREVDNALEVHNNLFSDVTGYAQRYVEGTDHFKPGLRWIVDNNYYHDHPENGWFVANEDVVNAGVTTEAMPFGEWTGGITTYQDDDANPLLDFDANSVADAADPEFVSTASGTFANNNYDIGSASPARSDNFPEGLASLPCKDLPLFATYPPAWIGINNCPAPTEPDMGAYQHISGKTLTFANGFLGLTGTATSIRIKTSADTEATLNAWTGA